MGNVEKDRERLLELIIKFAYFREPITLSSGKKSDYYIDARRITLTPEGAHLSASLILEIVKDDVIDAIGGPTLGADPMIGALSVLSLKSDRPLNTFIIRKAPKAHGKQQLIEGPLLSRGNRVVLIDDVATTGKAFVESIDILRHEALTVEKAICIVDRKDGAREALAKKDCELISIFTADDIHK